MARCDVSRCVASPWRSFMVQSAHAHKVTLRRHAFSFPSKEFTTVAKNVSQNGSAAVGGTVAARVQAANAALYTKDQCVFYFY
ncbi:hypothetical protein EVAR_86334_1 [Eumeta japonica]|uniref:Uncharacterized protein n=1 Tax=Eumeta variegata TaxID=151549 RepID=A0A4C1X591_EUMVA|nr:hypothetical protein EVAR_86334_1 [Eumeta japonica]